MYALVELHDDKYQPLADLTWDQNKVLYAKKHGYKTFCRTSGMKPGSSIGYQKIHYIRELMDEHPEVKWFWWTGTDTMITNFCTRIEERVYDAYHFIIASDVNGLNADSFLIRNTPEGKAFIDSVLALEVECSKHWDTEQRAFATVMGLPPGTGDAWPPFEQITLSKACRDIVKIMPQRYMNSFNYALYPQYKVTNDKLGHDGNWEFGDWLIHWPAVQLEGRLQLANFYREHIIK